MLHSSIRSIALLLLAVALLSPSLAVAEDDDERLQRRTAAFSTLHGEDTSDRPAAEAGGMVWQGALVEGATPTSQGVRFVLRSENATRVELELFGSYGDVIAAERANGLASPAKVVAMQKREALWVADVAGVKAGEVYGFRLWGPNWPYDAAFRPGTSKGFVSDVDSHGNRFNPNKLMIDPRAKCMTRDADWSQTAHASGPKYREIDSAATQGKSIVVDDRFDWGSQRRPGRAMEDTVVYEVHVKGMTKSFPGVADAGTYKAMADDRVIKYLKDLGVTAVELLPIHEAANDANDSNPGSTSGKNYWGYSTLGFFAPDRRYAADQSADGPVREFKAMVKKYHAAGLEVWLDVVYNHTAEGGSWAQPETATMLSFRGVDNQLYYELTGGNKYFWDNSGCGGNFRTAYPPTGQFIVDSLLYWANQMGVDGFRFDLASVVGNGKDRDGYYFQRDGGLVERISREVGEKGIKVVAEPWACGDGTYQVGNFPGRWAEWNGQYRDVARKFLKGDQTAGTMIDRINGSHGYFGDDGRSAHASVNFITAHDGLTLFDMVSYNVNSGGERDRLNSQAWPRGPSDGGEEHNNSWNCEIGGAGPDATAALRRQQARNALALLMLSNGTPMLLGGDERLRTQYGNNNTYNLDSEVNWLEWNYQDRTNQLDRVVTKAKQLEQFETFARNVIQLRQAFPGFHKRGWWGPDGDRDGDGHPGVRWIGPQGNPDFGTKTFGYRIDGAREELGMDEGRYQAFKMKNQDLLVLVNSHHDGVEFRLPGSPAGKAWYRVADTGSWAEQHGNFWAANAQEKVGATYGVNARSVVILVER